MPPSQRETIERAVLACRVFADWPANRLRELASASRLQRYRRHAQLIFDESRPRDILLVASGSIEVSATNADGDKYVVSVLGPGQVTNLVQLLEDAPARFACHARADSEVVHIPTATMRRMLDADPALWRSIALIMLRRFLLTVESLHARTLGSVRRRTAIMLLHLARRYGDEPVDAPDIELRVSQTELATMLGVSRQAVGKELAQLKDEGIVGGNSGYRRIVVLDVQALLRVAAED